ncbi:MAG TPA: response regulator [Bacteroidales bacterium]|nr:response regulator [Bacteroidales bacterium]
MIQTTPNKDLEQLLKPNLFESVNILIAEDDETNYFLIKEYLEFSNANLIWAQDGKEAIDILNQNNNIHLVLMDIQMPVMNGYDAFNLIKKSHPKIPVIALSAYAVSGDREKGLRLGFSEYLSKPVSRKKLVEIILQKIEGSC